MCVCVCISGGRVNKGDITDCKLDLVVPVGVCVGRCGELIWTCLIWVERSTPESFWVLKLPSHFSHRRAEGNHSDQYTDPEPTSRLPNLLIQSTKPRKANLPGFTSCTKVWVKRHTLNCLKDMLDCIVLPLVYLWT